MRQQEYDNDDELLDDDIEDSLGDGNAIAGLHDDADEAAQPVAGETVQDVQRTSSYVPYNVDGSFNVPTSDDLRGGLTGLYQRTVPRQSLADDIAATRRQQRRDTFTNLAKVLGQSVAGRMGTRIFTPVRDNTDKYDERYQRLRDAQRVYDINWNNGLYGAMTHDQQRAEAARASQRSQAFKVAEAEAARQARASYQQQAHQNALELEGVKQQNKVQNMATQQANAEKTARTRAALNLGNKKSFEQWKQQKGYSQGSRGRSVTLHTGRGETLSIPSEAWNDETIAYVFDKLPDDVKSNVGRVVMQNGQPSIDFKTKQTVRYAPTSKEKAAAIGRYIETTRNGSTDSAVLKALRELSGEKSQTDWEQYNVSRRAANKNDFEQYKVK